MLEETLEDWKAHPDVRSVGLAFSVPHLGLVPVAPHGQSFDWSFTSRLLHRSSL